MSNDTQNNIPPNTPPIQNQAPKPQNVIYTPPQVQNIVVPFAEENVRRVGTFSMALALIAVGVLMIAKIFVPSISISFFLQFSPIILVFLGIEILIANFTAKDKKLKYDGLSIFLSIVLIFTSLVGGAAAEYATRFETNYSQNQTFIKDYNKTLSDAVADIPYVSSVVATSYNFNDWPFFLDNHKASNGITIYYSEYFETKEEFAKASRAVMDKIAPHLSDKTLDIHFTYVAIERSVNADYEGGNLFSLQIAGYHDRNLSVTELASITTEWIWSEVYNDYFTYDIDAQEASESAAEAASESADQSSVEAAESAEQASEDAAESAANAAGIINFALSGSRAA